ncbi:serine hydrolase domain-containing protein [Kitasatospora sp. LaBMicrA B282]|uniref:serine hydrolase domain-containing protein n=1 Tax=Kitasatospora sp. LaBMicrA B282 TaxID=3420949 RepID=UPI003D0B1215
MTQQQLSEFVAATAKELDVPGVAVGILMDGQEYYAAHGVTSLANPLPVDEKTLFHLGSTTKIFTATALMRLVAEGRVELDAPVRRYVPELVLAEERNAAEITVLNLLNHTAGLEWNLIDTEDERESLADFVAKMANLGIVGAPGERASYSQAGFNLAGRIIEKVTGLSYERAMAELLLDPVGLSDTFFDLDEVLVRKFALGYNRAEDGTLKTAQPWRAYPAGARGNLPGGGIVSSAGDLLRWARFQLGGGEGVLPGELLHRMREQTVELRASSLGDGFGISWFLGSVAGVRTLGQAGSANGQFAELLIVPERDFAVVALSNAGPEGYPFNQAVSRWALERYLGLVEEDPEPVGYDDARAREVAGRYEIDVMNLDIATDGSRLTLEVGIKPEIRAASEADMPADYPPAATGFLPGDGDEYIITEGGLKGQRGFFTRDEHGAVIGVDLGGRLFGRAAG